VNLSASSRATILTLHEPYFADWVVSDPEAVFAAHGLTMLDVEVAFLSRVMTFLR